MLSRSLRTCFPWCCSKNGYRSRGSWQVAGLVKRRLIMSKDDNDGRRRTDDGRRTTDDRPPTTDHRPPTTDHDGPRTTTTTMDNGRRTTDGGEVDDERRRATHNE